MQSDHARVYRVLESAKYFHILVCYEAPHHPGEVGRAWLVIPISHIRNQGSEVSSFLM